MFGFLSNLSLLEVVFIMLSFLLLKKEDFLLIINFIKHIKKYVIQLSDSMWSFVHDSDINDEIIEKEIHSNFHNTEPYNFQKTEESTNNFMDNESNIHSSISYLKKFKHRRKKFTYFILIYLILLILAFFTLFFFSDKFIKLIFQYTDKQIPNIKFLIDDTMCHFQTVLFIATNVSFFLVTYLICLFVLLKYKFFKIFIIHIFFTMCSFLFNIYIFLPFLLKSILSMENLSSNILIAFNILLLVRTIFYNFFIMLVFFNIPCYVLILKKYKLIKRETIKRFRKPWIVISFIIGGILTPPDILSQILLAIPLIILWEICIFIV